MDIHSFIQTFNQTMGTTFYLEALPNPLPQASTPSSLDSIFWLNQMPHCLRSVTALEQPREKDLLIKLYHALNASTEDPLHAYLTGRSTGLPECLKSVVTPTRLLLISNLTSSQSNFIECVLSLASELLTLIWSMPNEKDGLWMLIEETTQLPDTLEAFCDTLASDYGILTQLILPPQVIHQQLLPDSYKLIEQMRLVGTSRPGVLPFKAVIVELIARSLIEPNQELSLAQYMPLETLALLMDEETIKTADQFLKNNLNITDTAKSMYIHRNTLLYRLEKIQKLTGFDLREFQDSWYFTLLLTILRLNVL